MPQPRLCAPQQYSPDQTAAATVPPSPRSRRSAPSLGWLLGITTLATLALVPQQQLSRWLAPLAGTQQTASWLISPPIATSTCQSMTNKDQRLSRHQLTQFLSLSQGTEQATVHGTIAPPYCVLSHASQPQQQEAYPLAFDPNTWFVVNYNQGQYTDFDFIFKK